MTDTVVVAELASSSDIYAAPSVFIFAAEPIGTAGRWRWGSTDGAGTYLFADRDGAGLARSVDNTATWTNDNVITGDNVMWVEDLGLFVAQDGSGFDNESADGVTWTQVGDSSASSLAYSNGYFWGVWPTTPGNAFLARKANLNDPWGIGTSPIVNDTSDLLGEEPIARRMVASPDVVVMPRPLAEARWFSSHDPSPNDTICGHTGYAGAILVAPVWLGGFWIGGGYHAGDEVATWAWSADGVSWEHDTVPMGGGWALVSGFYSGDAVIFCGASISGSGQALYHYDLRTETWSLLIEPSVSVGTNWDIIGNVLDPIVDTGYVYEGEIAADAPASTNSVIEGEKLPVPGVSGGGWQIGFLPHD